MTSASDEKLRPSNCFFQSREQVVVRRGQIRIIGWVIKTLEAQVGQFLLGCKCPVSRGIFVPEQDPLVDLPVAFFLQNVLQLHRVYSLPPLEDIQWGGCCLDPEKSRRELFDPIFALGIFGGGVSRHAATPLIVALSPGHSDVTRFCPLSQIATGNNLDRAEKNSKSCSDDWHRWRFWSAFRHFGTHFAENFRMSKSSWMMDPIRSREMPRCSAIDLAEIRRSSKISSWIWSIISGVVTVLCRPGRGASQVGKSLRLNWVTQFLLWHTMMHVLLMFLSQWRKFPSSPCLAGKKKLDDS